MLIDSCRLFGGFTMDAIAKCGFGLQVDSQQNKDDPFVQNAKRALDLSLYNPAFMIACELVSLNFHPFLGLGFFLAHAVTTIVNKNRDISNSF